MKPLQAILLLSLMLVSWSCSEPKKTEKIEKRTLPVETEPRPEPPATDVVRTPDVPPPAPEPIDPVKELYGPSKPFFGPEADLAKALPTETVFLLVADKPADLLRKLGYDTVFKERRDWFELASAAVTSVAGYNFIQLENFKEIGIDVDGVASAFSYRKADFAFGISVTLSDPALLTGWIKRMGEKLRERIDETQENGWTLLNIDEGRIAILVKPKLAFLVFMDGNSTDRMAGLARLIKVTPADSLASNKPLWEAAAKMDFGASLFAYASGKAMADGEKAKHERMWAKSMESIAQRTAQPPAEGETPEQAAVREEEAKRFADQESQWAQRSKKQFEAEYAFMSDTFGATTWLAGADVNEKGVLAKGMTLLQGPNLLTNLLKTGSQVPALFRMIPDKPMGVWSLRLDIARFVAILGRVAQMDGTTWDAFVAQFSQDTGVDAARILLCLSGEVSFTLWGEGDFAVPDSDDMLAPLRGAVVVTLSDPAYVQGALQPILDKLPADNKAVWDAKSKNWALSLSGHPLFLSIQGDSLVLTTEKELDLAKAPELMAPAPEKDAFPASRTFMAFRDASLFWMTDVGPLFSLALANIIGFEFGPLSDSWIDDRLGGPAPKVKAGEEGRRAEFEDKLAQLQKARQVVKTNTEKLTRQAHTKASEGVKDFGYFGMAARPVESGWEWFGIYVAPKAGLSQAITKAILGASAAGKEYAEGMELVREEWEKIYRLMDALEPMADKPKPVLPPGAYEAPGGIKPDVKPAIPKDKVQPAKKEAVPAGQEQKPKAGEAAKEPAAVPGAGNVDEKPAKPVAEPQEKQ